MAAEEVGVANKEGSAGKETGAPFLLSRLTNLVSGLSVLLAISWALDVPLYFNLPIWSEQYFALFLGLVLFLVFMHVRLPFDSGRSAPPWYDVIAALCGAASLGYISIRYPELSENIAQRPLDGMIIGGIALVVTLEGLRRSCGHFLLVVTAAFILYGLFGHYLTGNLAAHYTVPQHLLLYITLDTNGLLGLVISVVSTIVVTFIFFGSLLRVSGGSEFFTEFAQVAMGRFRGGSAKIAVTASALFGSVSGSAVANVASTGVLTIPMMKDSGYPSHKSAAIEAVASTGGQLMPPIMGAAAFIMAEFLQISYGEVIIAALFPAALYYVALFIQIDLEAARHNFKAENDVARVPLSEILREGWHYAAAFAVILIALFAFNARPSSAAIFGAISVISTGMAFGYRGKKLSFARLWNACTMTGLMMLDIVMIGAAAGFIIGILNLTGFSSALTLMLASLGAGNLFLMLLVAAGSSIILGLGMPTVGVYVLLAVMISPALVEVGVHPIASHLFVMYFGMMSMITPPVAVAAFSAAAIAKASPIATCFAAVRFAWPAYIVPFLFVASPTLILNGAPLQICIDLSTAIAGVWLISIGIVGYFMNVLPLLLRFLFVFLGLGLLIPSHAIANAATIHVAAFIGAAILLATLRFVAAK